MTLDKGLDKILLIDFGSQFTTWANNVAKNPFGRFVLSLGDEFKEVVEEGSKKGESLLETIKKLEKNPQKRQVCPTKIYQDQTSQETLKNLLLWTH